jgi:hypothetical protein
MSACLVHGENELKLNPEQDVKGQRGSRGIVILCL